MSCLHRTHSFCLASLTGLTLAALMLQTESVTAQTAPAGQTPATGQTTTPATPDPLAHNFYPLAKPQPAPQIVLDVSETPEAQAWAEHAQKLIEQWFPLVCQFLATEDYTPPRTLTLVFKKDQNAPAFTTGAGRDGARISINNKWITAHPDDFGMVIHEMTHVIQAYRGRGERPGWLVEGIADYIRFYRYEPDVPRPRINPQRATYHDAYRTTAAFLAWVTGKYDRSLVARLDKALRTSTYSINLFQDITGKPVDALWTEFIQTLPPTTPPQPAPSSTSTTSKNP